MLNYKTHFQDSGLMLILIGFGISAAIVLVLDVVLRK